MHKYLYTPYLAAIPPTGKLCAMDVCTLYLAATPFYRPSPSTTHKYMHIRMQNLSNVFVHTIFSCNSPLEIISLFHIHEMYICMQNLSNVFVHTIFS